MVCFESKKCSEEAPWESWCQQKEDWWWVIYEDAASRMSLILAARAFRIQGEWKIEGRYWIIFPDDFEKERPVEIAFQTAMRIKSMFYCTANDDPCRIIERRDDVLTGPRTRFLRRESHEHELLKAPQR